MPGCVFVKPAENDSYLLVNETYVSSGDSPTPAFPPLGAIKEHEDYDSTMLHSVAFPLLDGVSKAAVLHFIAWLAETTILAWSFAMEVFQKFQYSSGSSKQVLSPVVQICHARFVGKRRVKAARKFWVDKMLRAARDLVNMSMQHKHEESAGPFDSQLASMSFIEVGVGNLPLGNERSRSLFMMYGLCKLLQAVSDESDRESEGTPPDPGDQLASLQNIVRRAQVNGTSGLIHTVKALVA